MNNNRLKPISLILLAALTVSLALSLLACGGGDKTTAETTTQADTTKAAEIEEEVDSLTARQKVLDDLPDFDFEGRQWRTLTQTEYAWDVWVEAETGDIVNDAVYQRNRAVEERFNIVILPADAPSYTEASAKIKSTVLAGEDAYDVFQGHMIQTGGDALSKIFLNLYELKHADFTKPWYPKYAIEGLTMNGRMFIGLSDMTLAIIHRTYCYIYDKQMADSYGIEDISKIALEGKWTIDRLIEITNQVYSDLDGDSTKSAGDYYGFMSPVVNASTTYYYSFDIERLSVDSDGVLTLGYNDERMMTAYEKLNTLFASEGTWSDSKSASVNDFANGHSLIVSTVVGNTLSSLRDYENEYGIIPYPKLDEAQDNYYTICGGGVSTISVPKTISDTEYNGAVIEALSSETWRNTVPQYYDVALKVKGTRNEDSIQVLDLLLDGRAVDIALCYDGWKGFSYKLHTLVGTGTEWASYYASNSEPIKVHYQKVVDLFFEE